MTTQTSKNWDRVKLGQVLTLNYGKGLPARDRVDGKYPVYGSAGIVGSHNTFVAEGPGIIVGRKGSIGEIYLSKKNYYPIDTAYYINSSDKYDISFIYYLLKTLSLDTLNTDAAVPGLNRNVAYQQQFLLPDFPTQKQIADVLSTYDDLIENNARRIKILEEIAQAIYREWFVYFRLPGSAYAKATADRHEKAKSRSERSSATGIKMIDSKTEFGKIPEGWEIKSIKDFGGVITGKTPSKSDSANFGTDVPFIKTPDLHGKVFCIETTESLSVKGANTQKNKTLPPKTLVVSCIGTLGVVGITSSEAQTNQQINSVVLSDQKYLEYFYFVLVNLKQELKNLGANGATMGNVNKDKFENIKVLFPSQNVISEYHLAVSLNFDEILNLQMQNKNLRQSRDLLLPKLVTGEIKV